MSADLLALKNELLEFDRQLQRATLHTPAQSDTAASHSDPLALMKKTLDDRLATLNGSAWQLVLLEWRYDFALLFDHIRQWMTQVDADFSVASTPKA
ncbi:hypothetical protein [Shinella sp. M31]|uniref:hypothetical protein n=1 Tax=Shinella sp. M31 TaxID=3368615 RepID=UPI003BA05501